MRRTFEEAKAEKDRLNTIAAEKSRALQALNPGNGPCNLTPDAVKATLEWRAAKAAFTKAFDDLRRFNAEFFRSYKRELEADRYQ